MTKKDKKKYSNKDIKYRKVFQVSILQGILLFKHSPYYSSHAGLLILQSTSVPNLCELGYCNNFILLLTPVCNLQLYSTSMMINVTEY